MTEQIDTADTVYHKPTKESWVVACVHGDRLHWCGWPDGSALLSDCELKTKATPEARDRLLKQIAGSSGQGHRPSCARARLTDEGKTWGENAG